MNKALLDIYYDHYKESCELKTMAQNRRNRSFVALCVLEATSFLLIIKPDQVVEVFNSGINAQFSVNISFGIGIVQSLLWMLITYTMVRYCQDTLYVERQYGYLGKLEKRMVSEIKEPIFSREGDNYSNNYPMVLNFIDLFYKMFSPILFFSINIVHILAEWQNGMYVTVGLVCDTAICIAVSIITWFYFFEIHDKITGWCKKRIPPVDMISKLLRKILKEV